MRSNVSLSLDPATARSNASLSLDPVTTRSNASRKLPLSLDPVHEEQRQRRDDEEPDHEAPERGVVLRRAPKGVVRLAHGLSAALPVRVVGAVLALYVRLARGLSAARSTTRVVFRGFMRKTTWCYRLPTGSKVTTRTYGIQKGLVRKKL